MHILLPGGIIAFVLYGHSISLSTLITFVVCARWTGYIYYPHIKLSDCPYVRISFNSQTVNEFISIQDIVYINSHLL